VLRKSISILLFPLLAAACSHSSQITKVETKTYSLNNSSVAGIDSAIYREILPYKESMSANMGQALVESEEVMERGTPEGKLGNFFSDALMEVAKSKYIDDGGHPIDFAFFNNGGLRNPIPKGQVTTRNVYELMPFENEMVVLSMNGTLASKLFNYIAAKNGVPVSRLRMGIKGAQPVNLKINGQPY
jgi:2',3'-cyclic-nucleotide 2'-phosphodiesterase (5'-nucleotidase family)